jgi:hypothetical protein
VGPVEQAVAGAVQAIAEASQAIVDTAKGAIRSLHHGVGSHFHPISGQAATGLGTRRRGNHAKSGSSSEKDSSEHKGSPYVFAKNPKESAAVGSLVPEELRAMVKEGC